jgi:hypothetical protein
VRLLGPISEDEMIEVYLRAELESDRFGPQLLGLLARDGQELASADVPYRRRLLDEHRGYPSRTGMFGGFPLEVEWHRASLTRDELLEVLYIDYSWWVELSGGTRRPRDAARRIRAGELTGMTAGATAEEHEPFLASTSELIAVTTPPHEKLVVIEGHARLTAYALFPDCVPNERELILGVSAELEAWWAF